MISLPEEVPRIYIGIDPGVSGALGATWPNGETRVWDTPILKVTVGKRVRSTMDLPACVAILRDVQNCDGRVKAVIEWSQAMPRDGVVQAFSYGEGFGAWLGMLVTLKIPFMRVRPALWKREMLRGREVVGKDTSRLAAGELFPDADVGRKKDAGRAEALLLAEYGRRVDLGRA